MKMETEKMDAQIALHKYSPEGNISVMVNYPTGNDYEAIKMVFAMATLVQAQGFSPRVEISELQVTRK